jgi:hypothetical protein
MFWSRLYRKLPGWVRMKFFSDARNYTNLTLEELDSYAKEEEYYARIKKDLGKKKKSRRK